MDYFSLSNRLFINPKSYGLVHDVCVMCQNMCLLYADALIKKYILPLHQLFFHKSFNQPFTLKQDFVLEGCNILCSGLLLLLLVLF